jgi:hypothetical protein
MARSGQGLFSLFKNRQRNSAPGPGSASGEIPARIFRFFQKLALIPAPGLCARKKSGCQSRTVQKVLDEKLTSRKAIKNNAIATNETIDSKETWLFTRTIDHTMLSRNIGATTK